MALAIDKNILQNKGNIECVLTRSDYETKYVLRQWTVRKYK